MDFDLTTPYSYTLYRNCGKHVECLASYLLISGRVEVDYLSYLIFQKPYSRNIRFRRETLLAPQSGLITERVRLICLYLSVTSLYPDWKHTAKVGNAQILQITTGTCARI